MVIEIPSSSGSESDSSIDEDEEFIQMNAEYQQLRAKRQRDAEIKRQRDAEIKRQRDAEIKRHQDEKEAKRAKRKAEKKAKKLVMAKEKLRIRLAELRESEAAGLELHRSQNESTAAGLELNRSRTESTVTGQTMPSKRWQQELASHNNGDAVAGDAKKKAPKQRVTGTEKRLSRSNNRITGRENGNTQSAAAAAAPATSTKKKSSQTQGTTTKRKAPRYGENSGRNNSSKKKKKTRVERDDEVLLETDARELPTTTLQYSYNITNNSDNNLRQYRTSNELSDFMESTTMDTAFYSYLNARYEY